MIFMGSGEGVYTKDAKGAKAEQFIGKPRMDANKYEFGQPFVISASLV
jgi:hypothetical protein